MTGRSRHDGARLRFWRFVAWMLRLSDTPHSKPRVLWKPTLAVLERRYRAAEDLNGRDFARRYDYIPF